MKKVGSLFFQIAILLVTLPALSQTLKRGQIISPTPTGTPTVMDPNGDGFISKTNAGFSTTTNYWVPEFEIGMFGLPQIGTGDATGDNIGKSCGITDLIPDIKGHSVYAVKDANNNLIFRFRVGSNNPSVEAWTILLDTDGLFGNNDPNHTSENPGFEIDISLIKNQNFGVIVYNIDGVDNCSNALTSYSLNTHFQISVADEASCGDPDYFYDFYVPFADLAALFNINLATGVRIAAATNVSATCAMGGNISDISGVDNDDAAYKNCDACAFSGLINAQCPTAVSNLCETCSGFNTVPVNAPGINTPVRAGQTSVSGTCDDGIYIVVQVYSVVAGTTNQWSATPRETDAAYATGTNWVVPLSGPLQNYDKIVATAQKDANTPPCGLNGGSQSSTSVTVAQPNSPPVAQNQTVSVTEDTPTSITLTATDAESDPLTYALVTTPTHGTLSGTGANLTYMPNANYNGPDSFTFKASDGIFTSNTGTVTINVTPVNDPPVPNGQSVTTLEDTPVSIVLTGSDIEGSPLTFIVVTPPQHGTLSGTGANLTYTPSANYNGVDNFTFKVNDGTVDSNGTANVLITVTPVNDPPVANNQNVTVTEDTPKSIILSGTDPDGDPLTYTIVSSPTHGTLNGTAPNLTYTPAANYNGSDSFTFKANDGTADSNTATVSITVTPVNDAPIANGQSVTVTEDVAKAIVLNATDVDGDALTYTVLAPPAHGTLSGAAPNLTYTPAANYNGGDSFTFRANDGTADSNTATVSITVTPVNDAPIASNQSVIFNLNTQTPIVLIGNDVDGDPLTYSVVVGPSHGTLDVTVGQTVKYTPDFNYTGTDQFTFKVNDGTDDSNIATVFLNYNSGGNNPPIAFDQVVVTNEDVPVSFTLSANDPEAGPLTYTIVTPPSNGSLSGAGANLTYTPNANFNGSDSFTFKANDGTNDSNTSTVSITVNPVNDAPIVNDQSVVTNEDTASGTITLTGSDVDGNSLTFSVVTPPSHGLLTGSAPNFVYTPSLNYNGSDSFTFKANDGTVDSNIATISITVTPVNDAPVANPQTVSVAENSQAPVTLTATDVDGDALTYIVVGAPAHGTLSGAAPNITYIPNLNYNGSDSFTFKVNDGTVDSNMATVSITVTAVNIAPVANNQNVTTPEDTALGIIISANDVDGDPLTYSYTQPAHGTVTGSGTNLTYTPTANFNGNDSFTFKANDGIFDSNVATVSITVTPVNDAPVGNPQTVSVAENSQVPVTITATDVDGDALTYTIVGAPGHGTLSGAAPNVTYIPNLNYNGSDSFTFKANDGIADSNIATVSITVTPVNIAPVANNQTVTTTEDTAVGIVVNGSDVDGDPLTYSYTQPAHGTVTGTGTNLTYTPVADFNGNDSFTFKANDGTFDSNIATVSITVTAVNDAPIAADQSVSLAENSQRSIILIATDVDGNALTYTIVSGPAHGTLSGSAPNVTYIPSVNFSGSDSFTFKANDGTVDSNIATITITITPVNTAPIADNQGISTQEDTPVNIALTGSDADGDALTYAVVTGPAHGALTGTAPNFNYTPASNYNGSDSFTFQANDGTLTSNIATVSISVSAVADAPTADSNSVVTLEDTPLSIILSGGDVDGNAITFLVQSPPAHGTLTGTAPNMTYSPSLNFNGSDSFTFTTSDGSLSSATATISITVTPVNDAPVAADKSVTLAEDTPSSFAISATDVDGDALTYVVVTQPANGTLSGTLPNVTYTPSPNYFGIDNFTFYVTDGTVNSNTATVALTVTPVNDPPTSASQTVTILEDNSVLITLTGNDVDGDPLTFIVVTPPAHGTLTGSGANLTYTPDPNYNGNDVFTYEVSDGIATSNVSTITIIVTPVNDPPTANNQSGANNQTIATLEDTPVAITLTATDVDNDPLAYAIVTPPVHGTLTGSPPNVTYAPALNFNGPDSFTFKANDGTADSNIATVAINVTPVNDPPIIQPVPILFSLEDTQRIVCLSVVDVDSNVITFTSPDNLLGGGTMTQNATFGFCRDFDPAKNYNGRSQWLMGACDDGSPSLCASINIEIDITPVNDPPVAVNDYFEVEGRSNNTFDVLTNDAPIEPPYKEFYDIYAKDSTDILTIDRVVAFRGTATIVDNGARIEYVPNFDWIGPDSIRYRIHDSGMLYDSAVVFINVGPPPFRIYQALSPNGDGQNDYWRIDGIEGFPNNLTRVFDRFNNLVFETHGYSNETNNWTGQSNHGLIRGSLPEGTYFYSLDLGDGRGPLSGYVVLKRN
ncbi:MAG TPA: Ig-like domain-containing protein [Cyclobacteriaceae bacterium]|nr:Ig-like domain-containing protein [Cyclobacteriaceae bacterium]